MPGRSAAANSRSPRTPTWAPARVPHGAPTRAPSTGPRAGKGAKPVVPAAAPTAGGFFTFERATKTQCESNQTYQMSLDSTEGEYFGPLIVDGFDQARALMRNPLAPQHPAIIAFAARADPTGETMDVHGVKYHQLKHIARPDVAHLVWPMSDLYYKPDAYEIYTLEDQPDKVYVINPVGYRYEVVMAQSWPWTFELVVTVDMGPTFNFTQAGTVSTRWIEYAARFSFTQLTLTGSRYQAQSTKPKSHVLLIEYGEILEGVFTPWVPLETYDNLGNSRQENAFIYISNKNLVDKFFKIAEWNKIPMPEQEFETSDAMLSGDEALPFALSGASAKYHIDNHDHVISTWLKKGKEEGEWTRLANFAIDSVMAIYEQEDRDKGRPVFRLKVHRVFNNDSNEMLYLTPEMGITLGEDITASRLEAEVLVPVFELRDQNALHACFAQVSSYLMCETLEISHLKTHLNNLVPWPRITRVLTFFGKQKRSDLFVLGNCCFNSKGEVNMLDTAGIGILPSTFTSGKSALCSWAQDDFPRLLLIEQDWVRYAFFVNMWRSIIPDYFLNNTMAMKATFALTILHSHADRFWRGEAVGKSVPAGILKSTGQNTGKTKAQDFCNAFVGLGRVGDIGKGLQCGGVSSLAQVTARLAQQSCMSLHLDEIVAKVMGGGAKSWSDQSDFVKDLAHCTYDRTFRGVLATANSMGETRPMSSWVGSCNMIVNEEDATMWSRILLIPFVPIDTTNVDESLSQLKQAYMTDCEAVVSAILPDLYAIGYNGKLDAEALNDCATFMNAATGQVYNRNCNCWGFLIYYMCLLEVMAQNGSEALQQVFEYTCKSVVKQNYALQRFTSNLERFIIDFERCRAVTTPLSALDRSIHWHNYRANIKPKGYAQLANVPYIAIRLESACFVIKTVLKTHYKPEEIKREIDDAQDPIAIMSRGAFYDPARNPWPISKTHFDDETQAMTTVPLPEDELLLGTTNEFKCLFIKKETYTKLIGDVESVAVRDYKSIVIKSANPRMGEYNFYETVTGVNGDYWFGWRGVHPTPFARFCGNKNFAYGVGDDAGFLAGIEEMHLVNNFPPVVDCFEPGYIKQFYGYENYPDPDSLPPCFRLNPFMFRNTEGDTRMPNDPRTMHYENGLVDDYEDGEAPSKRHRADKVADSAMTPESNRSGAGSSAALAVSTPGSSNTPVGGRHTRRDEKVRRPRTILESDEEAHDLDDTAAVDAEEVC